MKCKVITPKKLDTTSGKGDKELEWQYIWRNREEMTNQWNSWQISWCLDVEHIGGVASV